ncbi:hypothetical protein QFZ74_004840 [Streptomyces sp. V3I7]|nr:hypothetical protein [Streptomyces sp. V3I7]
MTIRGPMYYCYLDIEISAEAHRGRRVGKGRLSKLYLSG